MKIIPGNIEGLVVFQPKNVFNDDRGYLFESYRDSFFKERLPSIQFIQENQSESNFGVLRGLHFQTPPYEQSKLVRVIKGEIQDVAVDLRKNSKTYKQYMSIILNENNKKQLFIPKGFAHGFLVLSSEAIVNYKMDQYYSPDHESGISYNDHQINIKWQLNDDQMIISNKDKLLNSYE